MARKEYVLCDICKEDITDTYLRVEGNGADVCAAHLMDPDTVLQALASMRVADELIVSRTGGRDGERYQIDLDSVVKGSGGRGITPKVSTRDFREHRKPFNEDYWKTTSFKLPMTNGIMYVGGNIPKLEPNDVYIDNTIAEEFAQLAVNRYLNG